MASKEVKKMLDSAEVEEKAVEQEVLREEIPLITDIGWSDYVMKHFEPDEMNDGNPTAEGLRRVAQLLLGDIIESHAKPISWPTENNPCSATVAYTVVFNWKLGDSLGGETRSFTELADVNEYNTEVEFRKHASATAATRAEGRALRKALKLKHVIAAEEQTTVAVEEETMPIKSNQINIINMLCTKHNINAFKFINSGSKKYEKIEDVSYTKATGMIGQLNKYISDKTTIPKDLIGFNKEWRNG